MFSKCILFVEGDTENGAMPVFAKRMKLDFDENGIGVVKLDGADSVENCMKLYDAFKIKSIAIIDMPILLMYFLQKEMILKKMCMIILRLLII